jgi:hypothetical protein
MNRPAPKRTGSHSEPCRGQNSILEAPALLAGFLAWLGCAAPIQSESPPPAQAGTPMKSNCPSSVRMPTVEECREAAMVISEELLRMCVRRQCSDLTVKCGEETRIECKFLDSQSSDVTLGFTKFIHVGTTHRFFPKNETYWCEVGSLSQECVIKAITHELAHSCGWDHGQGHGVPGNDSPLPECRPH